MKQHQGNFSPYYQFLDTKQLDAVIRNKELLDHLVEIMEKENLDDLFLDSQTSLNRVNKTLIVNEIESENQFVANLHNLIKCLIKAQRYDIAASLKLKTYSCLHER